MPLGTISEPELDSEWAVTPHDFGWGNDLPDLVATRRRFLADSKLTGNNRFSRNVREFVPDGLRNSLFQSPREPFLQLGGLVRRKELHSNPLLSRPANRRFEGKLKFIPRQSELQLHVVARS